MQTRYEFLLPGRVSESEAVVFPELTLATSPTGGTALFGPVKDGEHTETAPRTAADDHLRPTP